MFSGSYSPLAPALVGGGSEGGIGGDISSDNAGFLDCKHETLDELYRHFYSQIPSRILAILGAFYHLGRRFFWN
jgi:hypothetical protein